MIVLSIFRQSSVVTLFTAKYHQIKTNTILTTTSAKTMSGSGAGELEDCEVRLEQLRSQQKTSRLERKWHRFVMNYSSRRDYALHLRFATMLARRRTTQLLKHCRRRRLALKLVDVVDKHNGESRVLLDVVVGNTKVTERTLAYRTMRVREFLRVAKLSMRLVERLIADPASLSPKERKWQQEDLQGYSFRQLIATKMIQRWWRNYPKERSELLEWVREHRVDNGTDIGFPTRHCPDTCCCRCYCQGIRSCRRCGDDKPKCPNRYYDKRRLLKTYGDDAVKKVGRLNIPNDYYWKLQKCFSPDHPCSGEHERNMFRKTGRYFGSYGHGHPVHHLLSDTSRDAMTMKYREMCGNYVRLVWPEVKSEVFFEDLLNRVGLLLLARFVFLQQKVPELFPKSHHFYILVFDSPHGGVILEFLKERRDTFSWAIQGATGVVYDHCFGLDRVLQAQGIEWPQIGFHPVVYPMVLGRFPIGEPSIYMLKPRLDTTSFDTENDNGRVACGLSCLELGPGESGETRCAEDCHAGQRVAPFSDEPFVQEKAFATITRVVRPPSDTDSLAARFGVWSEHHECLAAANFRQQSQFDFRDRYGRSLAYELSFLSWRDHLECLDAGRDHFESSVQRRRRGYSRSREDYLWNGLVGCAIRIQQQWRAVRQGRLERATVIPIRRAEQAKLTAATATTALEFLAELDE